MRLSFDEILELIRTTKNEVTCWVYREILIDRLSRRDLR